MEFVEVVRSRRMIRDFDPDRAISRDRLKMLLKLAIRAPSAGHTLGRRFLILDDITSCELFWSTVSQGPADAWRRRMMRAPVLVIIFADREAYLERYAQPDKGWTDRSPGRWPIPYWHVDAGMASMTLLLAAQDAGLAACFFGVPGAAWTALTTEFGMDPRLAPVGVIALGHAAPGEQSRPLRRQRPAFDEVVRFGDAATPTPGSDDQADGA